MKDEQLIFHDDKYPKTIYCLPGENGRILTSQAEIKELLAKKKSVKVVRYRADRWVKFSSGAAKSLVIEDEETVS